MYATVVDVFHWLRLCVIDLGIARSGRLGSPYRIYEQEVIRLKTEL
jgi:hypothetical protein